MSHAAQDAWAPNPPAGVTDVDPILGLSILNWSLVVKQIYWTASLCFFSSTFFSTKNHSNEIPFQT